MEPREEEPADLQKPKGKKWPVIVVVLVIVVLGVFGYVFLRPVKPPIEPDGTQIAGGEAAAPTPELSYGPPEAAKIDVTVSPDVSIEIVPSAKSLANARFSAFDVSRNGLVVVDTGSAVVDMVSGEPVFTSGETVRSFAFVGDGLAVIDGAGKFGYYADEGRVRVVGDPPVPEADLAAASDGSRLYFLRGTADGEGSTPAIVALAAGASSPKVLTGSHEPIGAVGGDSFQTYFSVENSLFQLTTPGKPSLVMTLPEPTQVITGIAVGGGAVYFATKDAVYTLGEGIALPLAVGLGGDIRIVGSSLYVLEPDQRRIYRIALAEGGRS